jgi:flagellar hook-associated protein 3 FlgL
MAILPLQLARVSNTLRTSVTQATITSAQQKLLEVQNQLSTGKRLNAPSDGPGDAAIAQQIRKLLEQRKAYADNLTRAGSHLGDVDTTLGQLSDLLQQAQTLASANVGSDVTSEARQSAAAVVDALFRQLMDIGNHQFEGVYVFGGDRSTDAPFVEAGGGVKFTGDDNVLRNAFDQNVVLPFMVDGQAVFGALSSRVEGTADVSPALTSSTRLIDLRGATGDGVRLGSIQIGNGTTTAIVDLSQADTIGDVVTAINNAGVGSIMASISGSGLGLELTGGGGDDISINEIGGGTTAADLGILQTVGSGAGNPVTGSSVQARVTNLTPLSSLNGGAGIDTANGLIITNGLVTKTIDLSGATTVEDMLNAINGSGAAVRAEINAAGTGINILNPTQGTNMTIAENGGTTAADLGVRSYGPTSPLSELNFGRGVGTVDGSDIQIIDSNGVGFEVDLSGLNTVQDVLDAINTAATTAGAGLTASFATTGNGIVLTDTAGGAGTLTLNAINFSRAAADLGLTVATSGGVITGTDVNAVEPNGAFSHLAALRDALRSNDQGAITRAAEGLKDDFDRVVRIRGETGARVQEIESRQQRLEDQNVASMALLSSLEDVDFTQAIARFQTLQTALQASLQTSARILDLSLMDFLG